MNEPCSEHDELLDVRLSILNQIDAPLASAQKVRLIYTSHVSKDEIQSLFSHCKNVTHLCVSAECLVYDFNQGLKDFLSKNKTLTDLHFSLDRVEPIELNGLDNVLSTCYSMGAIKFDVPTHSYSAENDSIQKIESYAIRNQDIKKFLNTARQSEAELDSDDGLYRYAKLFTEIWEIESTYKLTSGTLVGQISHKQDIISKIKSAEDLHPVNLAKQCDLEKIKKAFQTELYDINYLYQVSDHVKVRVIDQTVLSSKASEEKLAVIKYLLEKLEASGTSRDDEDIYHCSNILMKLIQGNNQDKTLGSYLCDNEVILYDALAWICKEKNSDWFDKIVEFIPEGYKIEVNKQILGGAFRDYTLFQVYCLSKSNYCYARYSQSKADDDFSEKLFKHITPEDRKAIIGSTIPDISLNDRDTSEVWEKWKAFTVLQLLVHHGELKLIQFLLEGQTNIFTNHPSVDSNAGVYRDFNLWQLFVQGILNFKTTDNVSDVAKRIKEIIQLAKYITCNQNIPTDPKIHPYQYSGETSILLPIVHAFSLVDLDDVKSWFMKEMIHSGCSIDTTVTYQGFEEINALQLSVLVGDQYNYGIASKILFGEYSQSADSLIATLSTPIKSNNYYNGCNLLQYAVSHDNTEFVSDIFSNILSSENSVLSLENIKDAATRPFPLESPYPNWTIANRVIFLAKRCETGSLLESLLVAGFVDVKAKFCGCEYVHRANGLYPLTALFITDHFEINHDMNSVLPRVFTVSLKQKMINAVKRSNLHDYEKKEIYNQALLYAVSYYGGTYQTTEESEIIKALLENGANPFAHVDSQYRIADIAYQKGIGDIFLPFMGSTNFVIPNPMQITPPDRPSELNIFSSQSYRISENYSVVSLIRNPDSRESEHVFVIVEGYEKGLPCMCFLDFVNNKDDTGSGLVRIDAVSGDSVSTRNLLMKERDICKIENVGQLIVKQWQVPTQVGHEIIHSAQCEQEKNIKYTRAGSRSVSSDGGHNCYTWARRLLLDSSQSIREDRHNGLKPTMEEWIATIPSWKLSNNSFSFFSNSKLHEWQKVAVCSIIAVPLLGGYLFNTS